MPQCDHCLADHPTMEEALDCCSWFLADEDGGAA